MKKKIYYSSITGVILSLLLFAGSSGLTEKESSPYFKYVGITTCAGTCHKSDAKGNQLEIWRNSKHSNAYKVLLTEEADRIAKAKGFDTPAAETPLCIKCHILGKDIDPEELEATFDKTEGVQCETCHGPGSSYKKISVMKDRQQAIDNGLIVHENVAEFCKTCHNSDSPTFKSFNYDDYWAKIKHSDPSVTK